MRKFLIILAVVIVVCGVSVWLVGTSRSKHQDITNATVFTEQTTTPVYEVSTTASNSSTGESFTVEEFNPADIKSVHESMLYDPDEPDYTEEDDTYVYFTNTGMIDAPDALLLREQELIVDATQQYLDSINKEADSLTVIDGTLSIEGNWRKFAVTVDSDGSTLWISYNDATEEFNFEVE